MNLESNLRDFWASSTVDFEKLATVSPTGRKLVCKQRQQTRCPLALSSTSTAKSPATTVPPSCPAPPVLQCLAQMQAH